MPKNYPKKAVQQRLGRSIDIIRTSQWDRYEPKLRIPGYIRSPGSFFHGSFGAIGNFIDVEYPIATKLTRGKDKVTVKFHAHANSVAGGVFGCALLKGKPSQ